MVIESQIYLILYSGWMVDRGDRRPNPRDIALSG